MSIISALSKLLIKMGGQPISGDNADDIIDKITAAYNPSAGAEEFIITCTPTAQDFSGTMDRSPADILSAYKAGKKFSIRVISDGFMANEIDVNSIEFEYTGSEITGVVVNAIFTYSDSDGTEKYLVRAFTSTSTSTYGTELIELGGSSLPDVTSSDKGKYLYTDPSTGNLRWFAPNHSPLEIQALNMSGRKLILTTSDAIRSALNVSMKVYFPVPNSEEASVAGIEIEITGYYESGSYVFYGSVIKLINDVPTLVSVELTGSEGSPGSYTLTTVALS